MTIKAYTAGICAFAIALTAIAVPPASSQTRKKRYVTTTTRVDANRPRSRIFARIWDAAHDAAGSPGQALRVEPALLARAAIPYLNEPWYC